MRKTAIRRISPLGICRLIMVTSPNGGEKWVANSQHNVTWSADASVGNVVVEYSTDWGWTWNQIASGVRRFSGPLSMDASQHRQQPGACSRADCKS